MKPMRAMEKAKRLDWAIGQVIILHRKGQKDEVIREGVTEDQTSYTWVETFAGSGVVMVCTKDLTTPDYIKRVTTTLYRDVDSVTVLGLGTIDI